ncbi:DUF998 domain-containing protein [Thermomonas sp. XSG]|uniref:DUF998 domain-containing protein n=1 Tax=Thermomonas sp. XSG TaxID=2771436 RepID=UPI0016808183|nr:DUF998 domain-containing protein [Thermomonas sp. XSG]QNU15839.1 DUF998 domain-containing protein [Thermomonas sp. XSG]
MGVAIGLFTLTLLLARLGLPEYSHRVHPMALRGASGLPGAMLFNAGAFLLPGIALLLASQALRPSLAGHGWAARIGLTLAQLSALAFALQGALPLDASGQDERAMRLHALAWMLWWIAFVPGALLLAVRARRGAGFAVACLSAAVLVPLLAVLAPVDAWVGLAQRLAFALWLGWWLLAALALSRVSVSAPGSSPPARR